MATPIWVWVDRSKIKLKDLGITYIKDFTTEFEIPIKKKIGNNPTEVAGTIKFTPVSAPPPTPPQPEPQEPPVTEAGVIWDSLRDGKWDQKRVVDNSFGNIGADGKGFHMRASGDPVLDIQGNNEAFLKCKPGHGRMYGAACNYNSRLELEFAFMNNGVDNLSLKLRSRHQMGGACEHRFGGIGCSISLTDVGFKTEDCHNVHSNSISDDLPEELKTNTYYKLRFTCKDSSDRKAIEMLCELDYNDGKGFIAVLAGKHNNPKAYMVDKAKFEEHSEFWIRQNNEADGTIGLKNVKLIAL